MPIAVIPQTYGRLASPCSPHFHQPFRKLRFFFCFSYTFYWQQLCFAFWGAAFQSKYGSQTTTFPTTLFLLNGVRVVLCCTALLVIPPERMPFYLALFVCATCFKRTDVRHAHSLIWILTSSSHKSIHCHSLRLLYRNSIGGHVQTSPGPVFLTLGSFFQLQTMNRYQVQFPPHRDHKSKVNPLVTVFILRWLQSAHMPLPSRSTGHL